MSLRDPHLKMSKSHDDPRSRIHINDRSEVIEAKVKLALTDSIAGVSYERNARPGVSNLLDIMSYLDPQRRTSEELAQTYRTSTMRDLKREVTGVLTESLENIRARYESLVNAADSHYLEDIAREGSIKARKHAETTMLVVRKAIGL